MKSTITVRKGWDIETNTTSILLPIMIESASVISTFATAPVYMNLTFTLEDVDERPELIWGSTDEKPFVLLFDENDQAQASWNGSDYQFHVVDQDNVDSNRFYMEVIGEIPQDGSTGVLANGGIYQASSFFRFVFYAKSWHPGRGAWMTTYSLRPTLQPLSSLLPKLLRLRIRAVEMRVSTMASEPLALEVQLARTNNPVIFLSQQTVAFSAYCLPSNGNITAAPTTNDTGLETNGNGTLAGLPNTTLSGACPTRMLPIYTMQIAENAAPNTYVGVFSAYDFDQNQVLSYRILWSDDSLGSTFRLQRNASEVISRSASVFVNRDALDYDIGQREYNYLIEVADDASFTSALLYKQPQTRDYALLRITILDQAFDAPIITSIMPRLLEVGGGEPLVIEGLYLGLPEGPGGLIEANYSNTRFVHRLSDCRVLTRHTKITCMTDLGYGSDYNVQYRVSGMYAISAANASLNYRTPMISSVSGAGSNSTVGDATIPTGGGTFVIQGVQFPLPPNTTAPGSQRRLHFHSTDGVSGFISDLNAPWPSAGFAARRLGGGGDPQFRVTFGDFPTVYEATNCTIVGGGNALQCQAPPGAGARLLIHLDVEGQTSSAPMISYGPPIIADIEMIGAGSCAGGDLVIIRGANFATSFYAEDLNVEYAAAPLVFANRCEGFDHAICDIQRAVNCSIVRDHFEIHCYTAPGFGRNFHWRVKVAGQASVWSSQTTSFVDPFISESTPHYSNTELIPRAPGYGFGLSTAGGTKILLKGRGFYFGPETRVWVGHVPISRQHMAFSPDAESLTLISPPGFGHVPIQLTVGNISAFSSISYAIANVTQKPDWDSGEATDAQKSVVIIGDGFSLCAICNSDPQPSICPNMSVTPLEACARPYAVMNGTLFRVSVNNSDAEIIKFSANELTIRFQPSGYDITIEQAGGYYFTMPFDFLTTLDTRPLISKYLTDSRMSTAGWTKVRLRVANAGTYGKVIVHVAPGVNLTCPILWNTTITPVDRRGELLLSAAGTIALDFIKGRFYAPPFRGTPAVIYDLSSPAGLSAAINTIQANNRTWAYVAYMDDGWYVFDRLPCFAELWKGSTVGSEDQEVHFIAPPWVHKVGLTLQSGTRISMEPFSENVLYEDAIIDDIGSDPTDCSSSGEACVVTLRGRHLAYERSLGAIFAKISQVASPSYASVSLFSLPSSARTVIPPSWLNVDYGINRVRFYYKGMMAIEKPSMPRFCEPITWTTTKITCRPPEAVGGSENHVVLLLNTTHTLNPLITEIRTEAAKLFRYAMPELFHINITDGMANTRGNFSVTLKGKNLSRFRLATRPPPSLMPSASATPDAPTPTPSMTLDPTGTPFVTASVSPSISTSVTLSPSASMSTSASPSRSLPLGSATRSAIFLHTMTASRSSSFSQSATASTRITLSPTATVSMSRAPSSQATTSMLSPSPFVSMTGVSVSSVSSATAATSSTADPSLSASLSVSPVFSATAATSSTADPSLSASASASSSVLSPSATSSMSAVLSPSISLSASVTMSRLVSASVSISISPTASISVSASASVSALSSASCSVSPSVLPLVLPGDRRELQASPIPEDGLEYDIYTDVASADGNWKVEILIDNTVQSVSVFQSGDFPTAGIVETDYDAPITGHRHEIINFTMPSFEGVVDIRVRFVPVIGDVIVSTPVSLIAAGPIITSITAEHPTQGYQDDDPCAALHDTEYNVTEASARTCTEVARVTDNTFGGFPGGIFPIDLLRPCFRAPLDSNGRGATFRVTGYNFGSTRSPQKIQIGDSSCEPVPGQPILVDSETLRCQLREGRNRSDVLDVFVSTAFRSTRSSIFGIVPRAVCPCGKYAEADGTECLECPDGATCAGVIDKPRPIKDFWETFPSEWIHERDLDPTHNLVPRFVPCAVQGLCLSNQTCPPGSSGWMCVNCLKGYTRGYDGTCEVCDPKINARIYIAIAVIIIFIVLLFVLFRMGMKHGGGTAGMKTLVNSTAKRLRDRIGNGDKKRLSSDSALTTQPDLSAQNTAKKSKPLAITLLKLTVTYAQTLAALSAYTRPSAQRVKSPDDPQLLPGFLQNFRFATDLGMSFQQMKCAIPSNFHAKNWGILLLPLITSIGLPSVVFGYAWVRAAIIKRYESAPEKRLYQILNRLPNMGFSFAANFASNVATAATFFVLPMGINTAAKLQNCETKPNGFFLIDDPEISCASPKFLQLQLTGRILGFIYLVVPVIAGGTLFYKSELAKKVLLFLTIGYNTERKSPWPWAWECLVMFRKAVFTGVSTGFLILEDKRSQIVASAFLLCASLALHLRVRPYERRNINVLEAFALLGELAFSFSIMLRLATSIAPAMLSSANRDEFARSSVPGVELFVFDMISIIFNVPFIFVAGYWILHELTFGALGRLERKVSGMFRACFYRMFPSRKVAVRKPKVKLPEDAASLRVLESFLESAGAIDEDRTIVPESLELSWKEMESRALEGGPSSAFSRMMLTKSRMLSPQFLANLPPGTLFDQVSGTYGTSGLTDITPFAPGVKPGYYVCCKCGEGTSAKKVAQLKLKGEPASDAALSDPVRGAVLHFGSHPTQLQSAFKTLPVPEPAAKSAAPRPQVRRPLHKLFSRLSFNGKRPMVPSTSDGFFAVLDSPLHAVGLGLDVSKSGKANPLTAKALEGYRGGATIKDPLHVDLDAVEEAIATDDGVVADEGFPASAAEETWDDVSVTGPAEDNALADPEADAIETASEMLEVKVTPATDAGLSFNPLPLRPQLRTMDSSGPVVQTVTLGGQVEDDMMGVGLRGRTFASTFAGQPLHHGALHRMSSTYIALPQQSRVRGRPKVSVDTAGRLRVSDSDSNVGELSRAGPNAVLSTNPLVGGAAASTTLPGASAFSSSSSNAFPSFKSTRHVNRSVRFATGEGDGAARPELRAEEDSALSFFASFGNAK
jgi:hypothetical protein